MPEKNNKLAFVLWLLEKGLAMTSESENPQREKPERTPTWIPVVWVIGMSLTALPHINSCIQEQREIAERGRQQRLMEEHHAEETGRQFKERLLNGTASEVEARLAGVTKEEHELYKRSLKRDGKEETGNDSMKNQGRLK